MKNKLSAIFLALLLCGSCFVSCEDDKTEAPASANTDDDSNTSEESATEETEQDIYANLPQKDYDGYEFRVYTSYSNYAITYFDVDEINAEVINDAVFTRNRTVEKLLNIKIKNDKGDNYDSTHKIFQQCAASGDDLYDIMFSEAQVSAASSADGNMLNLYEIDGIDLSNPWWEQDAVKNYDIKGKLYFTYTPMHLHYYESLVTPLYNKTIAADNQIEDLQKLTKEGKWTIDKMNSIGESVINDVNGDGKMNANDDIFAASITPNLFCYFALGADCRFTEKDGDNIINTIMTERMASYTEKLSVLYSDRDKYFDNTSPGVEKFSSAFGGYGYIGAFVSNHALFYIDTLGRVKDLRVMDADFGLLPPPKYDEAQESYKSSFYTGAAIMFVPVTNKNYKNIGPILENLGAYSLKELIPAYYEKNITGKQLRDEASAEMLDIILDNIVFDIGLTFGIGGMNGTYNSVVLNASPFVSTFEKFEKIINRNIDKLLESYN